MLTQLLLTFAVVFQLVSGEEINVKPTSLRGSATENLEIDAKERTRSFNGLPIKDARSEPMSNVRLSDFTKSNLVKNAEMAFFYPLTEFPNDFTFYGTDYSGSVVQYYSIGDPSNIGVSSMYFYGAVSTGVRGMESQNWYSTDAAIIATWVSVYRSQMFTDISLSLSTGPTKYSLSPNTIQITTGGSSVMIGNSITGFTVISSWELQTWNTFMLLYDGTSGTATAYHYLGKGYTRETFMIPGVNPIAAQTFDYTFTGPVRIGISSYPPGPLQVADLGLFTTGEIIENPPVMTPSPWSSPVMTPSPWSSPVMTPVMVPTSKPSQPEPLLFSFNLYEHLPKQLTWHGDKHQRYRFSSQQNEFGYRSLQISGEGRGVESSFALEGDLLVWMTYYQTSQGAGPSLSLFINQNVEGAEGRIVAEQASNRLVLRAGDKVASSFVHVDGNLLHADELYTLVLYHRRSYGQTVALWYKGMDMTTFDFNSETVEPLARLEIAKTLLNPVKIGLSASGNKDWVQYAHLKVKNHVTADY